MTLLDLLTDNVTDISPVRAVVDLQALLCTGRDCNGKLADLSPLAGMKLETLYCGGNRVSDLSPLGGMPLSALFCGDTQVSDLSPLRGMPLARLSFHHTQASDLSPLAGMPLTEIAFTPANITKGLDIIRQMKSLKAIATGKAAMDKLPPAEFWKRYDAGEFGKPATPAPQPAAAK
ncbi:MAG TPA: hypothetical protein VHV08_09855 [Pirellulales bacterium]|nr:hypothetical protein [Pirellulales bacterium]